MFKAYILAASILGVMMAAPGRAQVAGTENVPRANFLVEMDREFGKMDADKNGRVTRAEIEAFERGAALGQARARAQARFAELDADKNGQLSLVEFGKLVTGAPAVDGRPLIAQLDGNKDGQITLIEHRAGKLSFFDRIDGDKDGIVSVAEMKTAGVIK